MPSHMYQLSNPIIEGSFTDTYAGETALEGASNLWSAFTQHIGGHVPHFKFTMKNISNNEYSHFYVDEKPTGEFSLHKMDIDINPAKFIELQNNVNNYNVQNGGKKRKKHRRRSSSSSSDTLQQIVHTSPIVSVNYNPYLYAVGSVGTSNPQLYTVPSYVTLPYFPSYLDTLVFLYY